MCLSVFKSILHLTQVKPKKYRKLFRWGTFQQFPLNNTQLYSDIISQVRELTHPLLTVKFLTRADVLSVMACEVASAASESCDPVDCSPPVFRLPWPQASPGKSTGAGCHFLLQWISPTQGSNPGLLSFLHWQMGSSSLPPPGKRALLPLFKIHSDDAFIILYRLSTLCEISTDRHPSAIAVIGLPTTLGTGSVFACCYFWSPSMASWVKKRRPSFPWPSWTDGGRWRAEGVQRCLLPFWIWTRTVPHPFSNDQAMAGWQLRRQIL